MYEGKANCCASSPPLSPRPLCRVSQGWRPSTTPQLIVVGVLPPWLVASTAAHQRPSEKLTHLATTSSVMINKGQGLGPGKRLTSSIFAPGLGAFLPEPPVPARGAMVCLRERHTAHTQSPYGTERRTFYVLGLQLSAPADGQCSEPYMYIYVYIYIYMYVSACVYVCIP